MSFDLTSDVKRTAPRSLYFRNPKVTLWFEDFYSDNPRAQARVIIQAAMISFSEFCLSVCKSVCRDGPFAPVPAPLTIAYYKIDASEYRICVFRLLFFGTVDLFRFKINCKGQNIPLTRDSNLEKLKPELRRSTVGRIRSWMLFTVSRSKNINVCWSVIFGFSFFVIVFYVYIK